MCGVWLCWKGLVWESTVVEPRVGAIACTSQGTPSRQICHPCSQTTAFLF